MTIFNFNGNVTGQVSNTITIPVTSSLVTVTITDIIVTSQASFDFQLSGVSLEFALKGGIPFIATGMTNGPTGNTNGSGQLLLTLGGPSYWALEASYPSSGQTAEVYVYIAGTY